MSAKRDNDNKSAKDADITANYYELHTDAVSNLVEANKENTPKYTSEELEKYTKHHKFSLPMWLKVCLAKWWGYGAICFFVFWGLDIYLPSQLDIIFVAGIIIGMATNLILNHFIRGFEKKKNENQKWMMVHVPGVPGFLLDILYGFLLIFLVVSVYGVLQLILGFTFGVEPILFGLITLGVDAFCLFVKNYLMEIRNRFHHA